MEDATAPEIIELLGWIVARREGLRWRAEGWEPDMGTVRFGPNGPGSIGCRRGEPDPESVVLLVRFDLDLERRGKTIAGLARIRREWATMALGFNWEPSGKMNRDSTLAWADELAAALLDGTAAEGVRETLAGLVVEANRGDPATALASIDRELRCRKIRRLVSATAEGARHAAHEAVGDLFGVSASTVRRARTAFGDRFSRCSSIREARAARQLLRARSPKGSGL